MDCRRKGIHKCEIYPASIDLYANKIPPTLDTVQTLPRTLGIAQKATAYTEYRPKSTGFSFRVHSLFFVLSGSLGSWLVEPLCRRKERETPRHPPIHLPPHLPTPRSAWSSRTMSGLERKPSATCSGVAGWSATRSSVEAGYPAGQPLVWTIR